MGDYSKFIHEKRRPVPTPDSIVGPDGQCVFGTFLSEFKDMDLLRADRPTAAPNCMNKLRLTLWEACEVNLDGGTLLIAVSDMAFFGVTLHVFYDKATRTMHAWQTNLSAKKTFISPTLLNGDESKAYTKNSHIKYVNNFEVGKATVEGHHETKEQGRIEYNFELERVSDPCVVSIPFGKNRPLYSQKDMFRVKGKLVFNGKEYVANEDTCAVIDDHRGYYPRKAHYDWVSTMGRCVSRERKYFGFNLTRNQSIDQEKYNENIIWLEGTSSLLPPVVFERDIETADFCARRDAERKAGKDVTPAIWTMKDEHGMVNARFKVYDAFAMVVHAGIVNIDYYIVFGELEGKMLGEDGTEYVLDGLSAIGEDKSLLF